jgi:membrane carboxypeptidase/penicillin-binding protein
MGYDNADGKRRTLGGGVTGGGVAVPIFEQVIQAAWANGIPKVPLAPPSAEAKRLLSCSGEKTNVECLRVDARGKVIDTQYRMVSRESSYASKGGDDDDRPRRRRARSDDDERPSASARPARTYERSWSNEPWRSGGGSQWGWQSWGNNSSGRW